MVEAERVRDSRLRCRLGKLTQRQKVGPVTSVTATQRASGNYCVHDKLVRGSMLRKVDKNIAAPPVD